MSTRAIDGDRRRLLTGLVAAPAALYAAPLGASVRPYPPQPAAGPGITRAYVNGRFGQIHIHRMEAVRTSKTPLMCFHPTAVSGDFFRDFMLEIGKDRLALAMDTPGYGNSDRPPSPQPMHELAGAAADALDALGFGKNGRGAVDMIGYHTGVYIATELAILRPDLVRRLVLPGISYYVGEERTFEYAKNAKPKEAKEDGSHVLDLWKFWVADRNPGVTLARGAEHFADALQAGPEAWWAYHGVFTYEAETRLPQVRQPVLVPIAHGNLLHNSRAAAKLFPNVQIVDMPELHHGIFDLNVDRMAAVTRPFLA
jgi:pimeloyl-ACP methyl ester carboxylesterase